MLMRAARIAGGMAPLAATQVWGPITATLDWCEENYIAWWTAELWNTLSNVFIFVPCFVGMYLSLRDGLETRMFLSYLGLASVGMGSWMFHMTLTWTCQLLDELPMIYASCLFLFCVLPSDWTAGANAFATIAWLAAYAAFVTLVYTYSQVAAFHEMAYAIQVLSIIFLTFGRARKSTHGAELKSFFWQAIVSYGSGFVAWNIDNMGCEQLKIARTFLGSFSPLLQFHAWWHIGVGVGSYIYIVVSCALRLEEKGTAFTFKRGFLGFPYINITPKTV